jgi:hypothetical protein
MATRVGLVQTGAPSSSFSTTIATSATIDYQIGDFIVAFARCNATSTQTVNSVALTSGGSLTSVGSPSPINIATRTTASAWYKVMTAAATGDTATATFSSSVDYRGLDVIVYRPGSGGALALDSSFGSNQTIYGVTTNTTSSINTTGGGVLCAFVGGTYGDFNSPGPTVSSGYTKIGTDTLFSAISEQFPSSSLSSESVTWTYSPGNGMSFSVAFDIAIKETGVATTIYDTASFSRGIGRGIARGIA